MNKQRKTIGIVIPAYNEASVIRDVLESLPRSILGHPAKIIVIDDGSSDATASVATQVPGVTVIRHMLNSGAGAATRTGIHYARQIGCDVVATIDADGQHRSEDLEAVVHAVLDDRADLVIGSRLINPEGMVRHRLIGNKGLSLFTFIIFGAWVTDSQSGLKAFNAQAADAVDFHSNDYAFCSEIIWRTKQKGLRITEVPIKAIYTDYSLSKGQSKLNGFNMLKQMMKRRLMGLLNE